MMVHTVNKSPFEKNSLKACLDHATKGSSILFIEDGIYGALKGTTYSDSVSNVMNDVKVFVLGSDLKARGMSEDSILDGIEIVDYSGFVELTVKHDVVQSWL